MLTVERRKAVPQQEWRAIITGLNGTPLHLPEVMTVGGSLDDVEYFLFRDSGECVAAGFGIATTQRYLKLFKGARQLYFPVFPALIEREGGAEQVCRLLKDEAQKAGYRQLEIDPRWGQDFSGCGELNPFLGHSLCEFTVDLRQDMDAILKGMHKKHRKNLREAEGHGVLVEENNSLEAFMGLRDMQQSSSERASERGNSYGIQGDEFFRATYEANYRNGPGRVLYARHNGEYVAALAFLAFGKKAVTVRSGSTSGGYETSAMYLLQVDLFRRLQEEGYELLNIGGVPAEAAQSGHPQHGLFDYKRYYGGSQCLRTGLVMPL